MKFNRTLLVTLFFLGLILVSREAPLQLKHRNYIHHIFGKKLALYNVEEEDENDPGKLKRTSENEIDNDEANYNEVYHNREKIVAEQNRLNPPEEDSFDDHFLSFDDDDEDDAFDSNNRKSKIKINENNDGTVTIEKEDEEEEEEDTNIFDNGDEDDDYRPRDGVYLDKSIEFELNQEDTTPENDIKKKIEIHPRKFLSLSSKDELENQSPYPEKLDEADDSGPEKIIEDEDRETRLTKRR